MRTTPPTPSTALHIFGSREQVIGRFHTKGSNTITQLEQEQSILLDSISELQTANNKLRQELKDLKKAFVQLQLQNRELQEKLGNIDWEKLTKSRSKYFHSIRLSSNLSQKLLSWNWKKEFDALPPFYQQLVEFHSCNSYRSEFHLKSLVAVLLLLHSNNQFCNHLSYMLTWMYWSVKRTHFQKWMVKLGLMVTETSLQSLLEEIRFQQIPVPSKPVILGYDNNNIHLKVKWHRDGCHGQVLYSITRVIWPLSVESSFGSFIQSSQNKVNLQDIRSLSLQERTEVRSYLQRFWNQLFQEFTETQSTSIKIIQQQFKPKGPSVFLPGPAPTEILQSEEFYQVLESAIGNSAIKEDLFRVVKRDLKKLQVDPKNPNCPFVFVMTDQEGYKWHDDFAQIAGVYPIPGDFHVQVNLLDADWKLWGDILLLPLAVWMGKTSSELTQIKDFQLCHDIKRLGYHSLWLSCWTSFQKSKDPNWKGKDHRLKITFK